MWGLNSASDMKGWSDLTFDVANVTIIKVTRTFTTRMAEVWYGARWLFTTRMAEVWPKYGARWLSRDWFGQVD